ncbi:MAG: hypothetical protein WCX97_02025 [Candidatus Magasanikbacteria bacterium]
MLFKKVYHLGDKLEDKVRGRLSHYPIIYAFVGGAGVIIFWRGIWHSVDLLTRFFWLGELNIADLPWWDGPVSVAIGVFLLLITGLFVSSFIGNEIIISGLKGEKRVAEKTAQEIKEDIAMDVRTEQELEKIFERLEKIEQDIKK